MIPLQLDHLVVTAPDLATGVEFVRRALGVVVPPGGKHPKMGTHNHLMRLGKDEFLEIIAVDPEAKPSLLPRWFALDRVRTTAPLLATWVVRCDDLDAALEAALPSVGVSTTMQRGDLEWRIAIRDDGSLPFEGAFPTLIEWPMRPYPGAGMADRGCRLVDLTVRHPNAVEIRRRLAPVFTDPRIAFETGPTLSLTARIETPFGIRTI